MALVGSALLLWSLAKAVYDPYSGCSVETVEQAKSPTLDSTANLVETSCYGGENLFYHIHVEGAFGDVRSQTYEMGPVRSRNALRWISKDHLTVNLRSNFETGEVRVEPTAGSLIVITFGRSQSN